jgi:hypothetical protein
MNGHHGGKLVNKTTGTLLLGAALGYAASLFLSPETRAKHRVELERKSRELKDILTDPDERERIREIFEENTDQAHTMYTHTKARLVTFLAGIRGGLQEIDKQKYVQAVDKALTELKKDGELPKKQLDRLRKYLTEDYQKIKDAVTLD